MKRAVLIACGLVLLGLILWLASSLTGEPQAPEEIAAPGPAAESPPAAPELSRVAEGAADRETGEGFQRRDAERVPEAEPGQTAWSPDHDLRVELLDHIGTPVPGETVQLLQLEEGTAVRRRAETDATTGIAEFRDLQRLAADEGPWVISVEAVLAKRIEVPFDPAAPPAEVVTIHLPPTGSVEVTLLSERATPVEGTVMVTLRAVAEGESRLPSFSERNARASFRRPVEQGRARFSLVEVGIDLEVAAKRETAKVATRLYGPGPASAGERISFEVQLGSDHPVILFRALGPDGLPLADAELAVRCAAKTRTGGFEFALSARTDSKGYAMIDVDTPWSKGTRRVLRFKVEPEDPAVPGAELDLSFELHPGINDLGDVVFEPDRSLFATGRIVTTTGAPVPGARAVVLGWFGEEERWRWMYEAKSTVDPSGAFEVRKVPPAEKYRIRALHSSFVGTPVDCARGDRNLELVLDAEGAIAGDLVIEPEIPERTIKVWIGEYRGDAESEELRQLSATVDTDGTFRLGRLFPGTYEIVVGTDREGDGLLSVPGVIVLSGETTRDPRLSGIDLRGKLRVHHLRLRGDESHEISGFGYRFRPAGAAEWGATGYGRNAEAAIVTPLERIDLEVFAAGCRSVRLDDVAGEIEVSMRAGLPVRLLLRGDGVLPDPTVQIKPRLVHRGTGLRGGVTSDGPGFDERRELTVIAPGPGEMEVIWVIDTVLDSMAMSAYADPSRTWTIEVLDVEGVQTFELVVSAEEMAELLGG